MSGNNNSIGCDRIIEIAVIILSVVVNVLMWCEMWKANRITQGQLDASSMANAITKEQWEFAKQQNRAQIEIEDIATTFTTNGLKKYVDSKVTLRNEGWHP